MNMEKRAELHKLEMPRPAGEPVIYQQLVSDEINLGDLLRALFREWRLLALVMAVGILCALAAASYLSRTYLVEAVLRVPNVNEMGQLTEQDIVQVSPQTALENVVEKLVAPDVVQATLQTSNWPRAIAEKERSVASVAMGILEDLSVVLVKHDYYQLEKNEKTPFRNIRVSLPSSEPEEAAAFVQALIENAHAKALANLSNDVSRVKNNRIARRQAKPRGRDQAPRRTEPAGDRRTAIANRGQARAGAAGPRESHRSAAGSAADCHSTRHRGTGHLGRSAPAAQIDPGHQRIR
jgi:LPS O-antigen subunit length determinant protein (WzzB/FepE family)